MAHRRIACTALAACLAGGCQDRDAPDRRPYDAEGRRRALAAVCRNWDSSAERRDQVLALFREVAPNRQDPLRPMAFDALACLGRWPDLPELVVVLHDETEPLGIRMRAAEALHPRTAAVESALSRVVDDPSAPMQLRIVALQTLGGGCSSAAATLIRALQQEPPVRAAAVRSLGGLSDAVALSTATRHADPEVRKDALAALASLGPRAQGSLPDLEAALGDPALRTAAISALVAMGHRAVPALVAALASSDTQLGIQAADALGRIRWEAKAAIPALQATARGRAPNALLRAASSRALEEIGPSFADLAAQLEASDEQTRLRALAGINLAVRRMGPEASEIVTPLRRRLTDPAANVRGEAIGALGYAGAVAALPEIIDRLDHDDSPFVRRVAALALGRLHRSVESPEGRASVVAALQRAESDTHPDVSQPVAQSLRQVRQAPSAASDRCEVAR